jgi:hypothetical protein
MIFGFGIVVFFPNHQFYISRIRLLFFCLFTENRKIVRYFIKLIAIPRKDEDYHKFQNYHIPKL